MTNTTLSFYQNSTASKIKRVFISALFTLVAVFMFALSALTTGFNADNVNRAEAVDWTRWMMCTVLPEPANEIYQYTNTDDLQFNLRSKSVASAGAEKIDSTLNSLLSINTEDDFIKTNEDILGRKLTAEANDPVEGFSEEEQALKDEEAEAASELQKENLRSGVESTSAVNGGEAVTPFQRFGVSGLSFTGYLGEWKYLVVDACSEDSEPKDPKAGLMYDERLEPQATWENRTNSTDIRVLQSTRGIFTQYVNTGLNVIANGLFSITKLIIVLTLAIIFLAFSDVPKVIGLDQLLGGEGGVFSALFDGIFAPLLWIAFLLTAANMFYSGIVKRQVRDAFSQFMISLLMMFLAFIAAAMPAQFVSLPNNVATVGQAFVITAVGGSISNTQGMCASEETETEITSASGASDDLEFLEEANKNIRGAIGCQFWEAFLLRPWSEGQFGDNYTKLWADDHIPSTAGENAESIGNDNDEMVGQASVPLGGGTTANNWALFQISTLTDAHAQINGDLGVNARITSSVSSDWWRIVDALSNYDETSKVDNVYTSDRGNKTVEYKQQKTENTPSEYWSQWVGNNSANRIGIAISSILVACVGVVVPLIFASLSAMYSVGLSLLMAFAPFMFLLSTWSKQGRQYFLSWLSLVLNVMMKRIAVGLMLILTIVFITTLLSMTDELSYWTILFSIIVISLVMYKSKDKIIAMFASFNFGSFDLSSTASRVGNRAKDKVVKEPVNLVANTIASGTGAMIGAKYGGGTMAGGLYDGMKYEMKNMAWRNDSLTPIMTQYDITSKQLGSKDISNENCMACNSKLEYDKKGFFKGGITQRGLYLCERCYKDRIHPNATPVRFKDIRKEGGQRLGWYDRRTKSANDKLGTMQEMHRKAFEKNNQLLANGGSTQALFNTVKNGSPVKLPDGQMQKIKLTDEQKEAVMHEITHALSFDMDNFELKKQEQEFDPTLEVHNPETPQQLKRFVDDGAIAQAWQNREYEYVSQMYAAGIAAWFNKNTDKDLNIDVNELAKAIMPNTIEENRRSGKH